MVSRKRWKKPNESKLTRESQLAQRHRKRQLRLDWCYCLDRKKNGKCGNTLVTQADQPGRFGQTETFCQVSCQRDTYTRFCHQKTAWPFLEFSECVWIRRPWPLRELEILTFSHLSRPFPKVRRKQKFNFISQSSSVYVWSYHGNHTCAKIIGIQFFKSRSCNRTRQILTLH